ncbi:high affinity immunoglobulin epsilon receptor subunit gamma [Chanos chanos]|uniref:high affinity immunoglobulin epsilon receptor subunit gamma n=1 Tax=Chanos chanos TaxID=29144 RepID=UPI0011F22AFA|nr:high affinity immunoglobulin epsilon receptor subunit gamma [Chanos chanos]
MKGQVSSLAVLSLWMSFGSVSAALEEPKICYILDGILFFYGILLTILYCRLKVMKEAEKSSSYSVKKAATEGVYEGLAPRDQDTYETIQMKKTGQ